MNKKIEICYWCGDSPSSRDHIPPVNLFPKGMKSDLITVPSCEKHNNNFQSLDDRMMLNLIGTGQNSIAIKEVKRINRAQNRHEAKGLTTKFRSQLFFKGNDLINLIDLEDFRLYFERIYRGLYFKHCNKIFMGKFDCDWRQKPNVNFKDVEERVGLSLKIGLAKNNKVFNYKYCINNEGAIFLLKFYETLSVFTRGIY